MMKTDELKLTIKNLFWDNAYQKVNQRSKIKTNQTAKLDNYYIIIAGFKRFLKSKHLVDYKWFRILFIWNKWKILRLKS